MLSRKDHESTLVYYSVRLFSKILRKDYESSAGISLRRSHVRPTRLLAVYDRTPARSLERGIVYHKPRHVLENSAT